MWSVRAGTSPNLSYPASAFSFLLSSYGKSILG